MIAVNIVAPLLLAAVLVCGSSSTSTVTADRPRMSGALAQVVERKDFVTNKNASDNLCAAFGWRGVVDTDLNFSEFFNRSHTVAVRFMIQYPRSYMAPILSVNGAGEYLIAVAGYGEGRIKAERLLVSIGTEKRYYTVAGRLAPEKWHWLALVRDGSRQRLYLDGELVKPDDSEREISSGTDLPVGTLRLGRNESDGAQFYGLMDDVAVFDSALSQKILKSYYQESPRLRGTESGLVAAYLFDRTADAQMSLRAPRRVSFTMPAKVTEVSDARDSRLDMRALPLPTNSTKMLLPFAPGTAWKVIQGYGQALSHNGGGCFSWDFAHVDGSSVEQPVYACAAGRVVAVSDNNDPEPGDRISKDNFNYLQMETAPGEVVTYLHMKNGSLINALKGFAPPSFPDSFASFTIAAGTQVGEVGNTWLKEQPSNWHLHFAGVPYVNSPVSMPLAFSDYEVYDPHGKTWQRVERGVPQQDQIVRRATNVGF